VDELLGAHRLLSGPRCDTTALPQDWDVISASHTDRQSTLLIRSAEPVSDVGWTVSEVSMEDLVLAYMSNANVAPRRDRTLEARR
jgi:ABC-2 type transport system ATP-binding protein